MYENPLACSGGGPWSSPAQGGFGLEKESEVLIHDSPEVFPGVSPAALAVDQFRVPRGGSVELVALEEDRPITVVGFNLAKNAEVRRALSVRSSPMRLRSRSSTLPTSSSPRSPKASSIKSLPG
jgi:hypothetical protein